ncbi:MAG: hypothetical protein NT155_03965 [Candidatus Staskawiczbacteria bacterium]|nr:hypothetical protein [Candidatus Staskawiczbacteria bacterium]
MKNFYAVISQYIDCNQDLNSMSLSRVKAKRLSIYIKQARYRKILDWIIVMIGLVATPSFISMLNNRDHMESMIFFLSSLLFSIEIVSGLVCMILHAVSSANYNDCFWTAEKTAAKMLDESLTKLVKAFGKGILRNRGACGRLLLDEARRLMQEKAKDIVRWEKKDPAGKKEVKANVDLGAMIESAGKFFKIDPQEERLGAIAVAKRSQQDVAFND